MKIHNLQGENVKLKTQILHLENEVERLNKDLQTAIDICNNRQKEIVRINKGLEYIELYWSNREEYEKNELLRQIRDKDTSIEWLERAIEEEKKRERLY